MPNKALDDKKFLNTTNNRHFREKMRPKLIDKSHGGNNMKIKKLDQTA